MKKSMQTFILFLYLSSLISCSSTQESLNTKADPALQKLIQKNNAFAIDLYQKIKQKPGNLFLSPYSISTAMSMTYAGAKGETEKQISKVFHFNPNQKEHHQKFSQLEKYFKGVQKKGDVELNIANALWLQQDYKFLPDFLKQIETHYNSTPFQADFIKANEDSRNRINKWAEEQTNKKIKDLLKAEDLSNETKLVLTNAIYFKGDWAQKFKEKNTKPASFWLTTKQEIQVPTMYQKEEFRYLENEQLQILELPYLGKKLSMLLFLPKQKDGLAQLENSLTTQQLDKWRSSIHKKEVNVHLPKFKTKSEFKLSSHLKEMGIIDAFEFGKADFSGMDGTKKLVISEVVHQAFVNVNEKGTEAAASTAVVMKPTMAVTPTIFKADHPFIFLIQENESKTILFMGRILDPRP